MRSARIFKELMISGTTIRNKRHGAEDSSGQDRMGGYTRWPEAYLVTLTDRCSFLCVSGQRRTIAKSMHEEHLSVCRSPDKYGARNPVLSACLLPPCVIAYCSSSTSR